ncbi:uncharacterized protein KY384_005601 [Bacidia gigantensis]|uniref:uncharacterized protein n=1 Tax=Bacidia gigantensis TaxID=2732470 RepID=UPI001D0379D0|nr:uncharacterized protein KY384_005601 [Bacidia gigantensis]KAG8530119.1 hypothetical protein KY384_005601 [Bacidia gigantensis]
MSSPSGNTRGSGLNDVQLDTFQTLENNNAQDLSQDPASDSTAVDSHIPTSDGSQGSRLSGVSVDGGRHAGEPSSQWQRLKARLNPWTVDDDRYDHFKAIHLEDYPDGYPRLAAFMTSDINTRVFRRFGWERNRLLLHKQDRIAELSDQLRELDKADEVANPERLYSRRDDEEQASCERQRLMHQMSTDLKEYDDLLTREHTISSITKPSKNNHRTIFDWVYNNKPVVWDEYQYLYQQDDFVLLGNQRDNWLRSFDEKIWALSHFPIFKKLLASKKHNNEQSSDPYTHDSSNYKADLIIKLTVTIATTALLVLPIVLLYVLKSSPGIKLTILLLFVIAFSMALALTTGAKRHEIFAATAAYCAVLVVFLSNLPGS